MGDTSLVFNLIARDQASGEVSAFGERINTAAATIGAGFAAALATGVMANLDMEAAGDKLAAQLGVGPAEAAELSKVSASVYKNAWGDSIDTVNMAVRGVYENIGDTAAAEGGIEGLTTKALVLAETFDQEVGATTRAVGQMLKTGLAANADEAFDIITAGMQRGADGGSDFLDTIIGGADNLKTFGFTGKQATGLIVQGLGAGAESADSVIGLFEELVGNVSAGGDDLAQTFKDLGLNGKQMSVDLTSGGPAANAALDKLLDSIRALKDPIKQDAMMAALFGEEGAAMQNTLMAIDPSSAVAALGEVEGATNKAAKVMGDNPKAALETFKRTAMLELGEAAGVIVKFGMENKAAVGPLLKVFAALAALVITVKGAMMVYTAVSTVVTAAHAIMSASAWGVMGNWIRMNAIGLATYARIAGAAVLSAATTAGAWVGSALVSIGTWIAAVVRAGAMAVGQFVMMAARAIAWAAVMAAQWLIAMGPVGWVIAIVIGLAALIILNWDKIKKYTGMAWDWVWNKIKMVGQFILNYIIGWELVSFFLSHWDRIKTGTINKVAGLLSYVRGLPGRISGALGNLGSLLYGKGMDVVRGLWNGIKAMGSWLKGTLIGWARDLIPGPIADALGISSPSKVMAEVVGRWIPAGVVEGIKSGQGDVNRTMASLVQAPGPGAAMGAGRALVAGAARPLTRAGGGQAVHQINLVVDGKTLARVMYDPFRGEIRRNGGAAALG
ncbi:phage tail tape measure protein [Streptomyces lunaelactis]|uniref:phage tail tape measure protein n=1 Tax=Streptomyces lunaelactis TaxID=1535768 RepID=UPI0015849125|nr:phage tail tape measure protein [Streptomyces lunaelactis]NUL03603.1 phage tail tape measure protein [Streptomyces lunaelactis]